MGFVFVKLKIILISVINLSLYSKILNAIFSKKPGGIIMRGHETITKKEYVEDQFLADSMFDEDKLARSQVEKKYLQQLQNEANDAYIKLLAAQEAYDIAMSKLKAEEAKQVKAVEDKQKSSPVKIYGALDITIPPMEKKQATKSKQAIAPQEMKAVEKHFENLPSHLQSLMEAVLGENITLGLARDPVFIRGEGIVYDRSTAEGWLKDKAEALLPHNPGKTFTKADIITCNTIIDAMADLMKIIQGKEAEMKAPASLAKLSYTDKSLSAKRVLISTDTIEKIEKAYASFPININYFSIRYAVILSPISLWMILYFFLMDIYMIVVQLLRPCSIVLVQNVH